MITEMQYVRKMLSLGGYTLVICDGGRAFTSEDKGILPLWETVKSGEDWENAHAALKTLGKAEALLLLSLKAYRRNSGPAQQSFSTRKRLDCCAQKPQSPGLTIPQKR